MDWGMKNRLSRILKPQDGRTVMLAVDHGYFLGPTTGLENPWKTVEPLVSYADCLMPTRGILRSCIPPETDIPVVLRVSGGTSIVGPELLHEGITVAIDDALRLNACGLAFSILVGAPYERDTLLAFSEICDAGQDYGIPVLAVTAVGRDMVRDAKYLALASRIAAEIGAHMVKTYHCEGFERVVEGCPVPVVIAGGKKVPEREALQMAADAVQAGAVGVDMGRNIFQSENPVAMIRAVRAVVHENATADEAYQLFEQERGRD
jgi:putative autoinducer-2 (AI-2) aldolase